MKRKISIWLLATLLLTFTPLVDAQQPAKVPRIGHVLAASPSAVPARIDAFRQGLRELGYVEGKTLSSSGALLRKNSKVSPGFWQR